MVVENFRPGVMEGLGLGFEQLHADDPALIYCSITGFGRRRRAPRLPGYDLLVQAVGGLMSITGAEDGQPQKVGVALVDVICGLFASVGILAALRHREQTGEGQRVELDLLSCLLAALVNQGSAYTSAGEVATRMGNGHRSVAPYDLFRAADGELVIAVGTDEQFHQLTATLGCPELAGEEAFSTNTARVGNRERLREELEARLMTRPPRIGSNAALRCGRAGGPGQRHRRRICPRRAPRAEADRRDPAPGWRGRAADTQPDRTLGHAAELPRRASPLRSPAPPERRSPAVRASERLKRSSPRCPTPRRR